MANHWEVLDSGRIVVSNTPHDLWNAAVAYFKWCDENPVTSKQTITSGRDSGRKVEIEVPRPYTVKGLCIHCGILEEYIRDVRQTKEKESEWYIVISRILYIIFVQNAEYATTNVFNPIFTSKMLNLEKDDVPTSAVRVEIVGENLKLSESENEVLEKMEMTIVKSDFSENEFNG